MIVLSNSLFSQIRFQLTIMGAITSSFPIPPHTMQAQTHKGRASTGFGGISFGILQEDGKF